VPPDEHRLIERGGCSLAHVGQDGSAGAVRLSNLAVRAVQSRADRGGKRVTHHAAGQTELREGARVERSLDDALAALVTREVAAGGAVTLPGLGKVACRARPERQVRNPATNETLTKPADKQVKFTIAKALKDSVNV
jgi:nucleoid DNA-binding protein